MSRSADRRLLTNGVVVPGALPNIAVPRPGEVVPRNGNLRAEVPQYIIAQLRVEAFRTESTQVAVILRGLHSLKDDDGKQVFFIRPEDLVEDRRRLTRRGGKSAARSKN